MAGTDFNTTKEGDNGIDHTEGTAQEDGDSQPLLDAITDPIIDALTAHARVLTSTLAGDVADMSRRVGDDTTCRSNFGQMGPCRRHKI